MELKVVKLSEDYLEECVDIIVDRKWENES